MTESDAFARALDQPGNVLDDELAAVRRVDRAEDRRERGERVVGDLRLRVRDPPRSDDLPALGRPTSAASASSFRWSSTSASSPGMPISANRGVWRVGVAKWRFPRPERLRGQRRLARRHGPGRRPARPRRRAPRFRRARALDVFPGRAVLARTAAVTATTGDDLATGAGTRTGRAARVSATRTTEPPGPPSPPSGPPFGTCFSRRKLSAPSPPRPACT